MQAYTISVPSAVAMPHSGTLLAQMLMRTAAITHLAPDSLDPAFFDWWHTKARPSSPCLPALHPRSLRSQQFCSTEVLHGSLSIDVQSSTASGSCQFRLSLPLLNTLMFAGERDGECDCEELQRACQHKFHTYTCASPLPHHHARTGLW